MIEELPLGEIRQDGETQARTFEPLVSKQYLENMLEGDQFPALIVFRDDEGNNWLADGFHRIAAAYRAGKESFPCDVRQGSQQDAQWFALGANNRHGLMPSSHDYEKFVRMAVKHPNGKHKSDREIARHLGISPHTVAKYRATVQACTVKRRVKTKDGREYDLDTSNIGKRSVEHTLAPAIPPAVVDATPPKVLAPESPRDTWPAWAAEVLARCDLPDDLRERYQALANARE